MNALDSLLAIPEAETVLNPAIFVEAKDRDPKPEGKRQAEIVAAVRKAGMEAASSLNAGRRPLWERNKAKGEGMRKGWPDVSVAWDGGRAELEIKNGSDQPDPEQVVVLNRLHRWKHHVAVVRTVSGALHFLASKGAPVREGRL